MNALEQPCLHLIRIDEVLAPTARISTMVVPSDPAGPAEASQPTACEPNCVHSRHVRLSWARMLKRVIELDLGHCPNCGGELKTIAAIRQSEPGRRV